MSSSRHGRAAAASNRDPRAVAPPSTPTDDSATAAVGDLFAGESSAPLSTAPVVTARIHAELAGVGPADGSGDAALSENTRAPRSGAAAQPSMSGGSSAASPPPRLVTPSTGQADAGGAIVRQAEAVRRLREPAAPPIAATAGGAAGAPLPSAGVIEAAAVVPPAAAMADLVVASVVHLTSGAIGGGVEAELSAGHLLFVDGADYVTAKNLVMRLFLGVPDVATRLMRLGCLPGRPDAVAEAAAGGPNARTTLQRAADQQAYKKLVAIARYAELWGFDKPNLCAVVKQALYLAETKQFATVASVAIAAASAWTMHTASATNSGVKSTSVAYAKSVQLFCQFASNPESQQPGGVVLPVNRYVVVTFLRSEQARPKRTGNQSGIVDDE